jgi:CheY-like chemotaxis protein
MPRKLQALICQTSAQERSELIRTLGELTEADFDFIEAESGHQAVDKFDPACVDLALIDRFLGPVNGIDVTRLLRARHGAEVPVIMLSSEASRDALVEAVEVLSVNGYLLKPIDPARLRTTIANLISVLPQRPAPADPQPAPAESQAQTATRPQAPAEPAEAPASEQADPQPGQVSAAQAEPCTDPAPTEGEGDSGEPQPDLCPAGQVVPPTTQAEHSEVIAEAVSEIFNTTCGVHVELSRCQDHQGCAGPVIIGVIGVFGDLKWSIKLGLPKATAEAMCEKFAGFPIPFEEDDMADAVGEMANVFVGQVKRLLDAKGLAVEISLPAVMRAEEVQVLNQGVTCELRSCYDTEIGRFWTCLMVDRSA